MGLKVLLKIDDQVQIRDVKIKGEDEIAYMIDAEGLSTPFVRKSMLYQNLYGNVFGFDREKMIKVWNESILRQVEFKEVELRRLKNSVIPMEFKGDKYKIEGYRKEI